ncbi:glycine cleavage system aminomethyltransferase GcvT [Granulicoccus sp. GXG6511]|uniref:glycine cleavage system aminomethyltransferase GcvT n=1 Tax=Granulicoccus sp. GXG6511 TaxID=3381351 RepID=UPI003D7DE785
MSELKKSPLHARHEAAGAKFAEFGGWSMPLQYAGIVAEHKAVRASVGVFDVSHLGKATVRGEGAVDFLNTCLTNDMGRIGDGQAQYTLLCNESGGVVDDLIVYQFAANDLFLIPNASNNATVVETLRSRAPEGIEVANIHDDYAVLAVQGPKSDETLTAMGLPVGHDYMSFDVAELDGVQLTVCRTGYTGERGYELVAPTADALKVWDAVMAAGAEFDIVPAGLGARDTLRTEMGYPLHGQDLSPEISPVKARAGWAVGWKKPEFIGHEALRAEREAGAARKLWGLKAVGRGIPRPHMVVVDGDGNEIGEVTSGTFSPSLQTGIGLALVDSAFEPGIKVGVKVRNRVEEFDLVKPPFLTPGVRES